MTAVLPRLHIMLKQFPLKELLLLACKGVWISGQCLLFACS